MQKRSPRVGLEDWGVVTECLEEILPHYISLAMFGNLEVFFVSLSLLCLCFVIMIKHSRAQRETKSIISPSSSLSVALELNGYLE